MPQQTSELSMVIVLPRKVNWIKDLESSLDCANLEQWIAGLSEQEVIVHFPKFRATARFELSEILEELGMRSAFRWGDADFSGMDGGRDLFIALVVHEAFVEVSEEGTEAAAATAVIMMLGCAEPLTLPPTPIFHANRPFLYFIRNRRNGSLLFMGRLMNPSAAI